MNSKRDILRSYHTFFAIDAYENTIGGQMIKSKLKGFVAIQLYEDMKCQSNIKFYWHKGVLMFYCYILDNVMTCSQIVILTKCLHITYSVIYVREGILRVI